MIKTQKLAFSNGDNMTGFATAELWPHKSDPNMWSILRVYSTNRGAGLASQLMRDICEWADTQKATLILEVNQFGDTHGLNNQQLESWYARFGFEAMPKTQAGHTIMVRNSQKIHGV